ncbi:dephospho-CoA kinase [Leptolyngbya sp. FACHB-711]|uniref:dephospho-CoA kinase n=1 Tax=unclassified Leptolyngbya TaxID=2650499 RepID=UPI0016886DE5|nr:dephospho-CoA kinase [Leptolyngbya sp. FACHB-711]MBD1848716.1 dephospho-CoA kinase [Cyanobacteria bacterium FACHB-502]MBD2025944.1 dephospho-CoA kinase [Leptolyngbya sp. FACHB-711]
MTDSNQPSGNSRSNSASSRQRIIGITGGVGMGKTTVSGYLAQTYQIPVLDADLYAREAVHPGSRVLREVVERYGKSVLQSNGQLDRRRLGDIIFSSSAERLWLEQQIHPYVRDRMQSDLRLLPADTYPIVVLVIPLLFEARMTDLVTEIWVVRTFPDQQRQRLRQRDQLDSVQIQARIDSQMAIERKVQQANVVLDNTGTLEDLYHQIDAQICKAQDGA